MNKIILSYGILEIRELEYLRNLDENSSNPNIKACLLWEFGLFILLEQRYKLLKIQAPILL